MKTWRTALSLILATLTFPSCQDTPSQPRNLEPPIRGIGLGFETITLEPAELQELSHHIEAAGINTLYASVGRIDWTAFPWPGHANTWSQSVTTTQIDYLQRALSILDPNDNKRIVLIIDTLAPRFLQEHPDLAGVDPDGNSSPDFTSVAALADSPFRTTLLELTTHLANTYNPDEIAYTELMYDNHTFGPADLQHFKANTDSQTWPTTSNGTINTADPALAQWRSTAIAKFLNEARQSVANAGTDISIDVRTSPDNPTTGRAESGHDLTILGPTSDRITIWNYFGLNAYPPQQTRDIVEKLDAAQLPTPYVVSIGLWNTPTEAEPGTEVSPDALATALSSIPELARTSIQVTPASLMTNEHWDALTHGW